MHHVATFVVSILAGCASIGTAFADIKEWSASVRGSCDDPYVLKNAATIREWLPQSTQYQRDRGANNVIAELSSRLFRDGTLAVGKPFQNKSVKLTAPYAQLLRDTISRHTEVFDIPWYSGLFLPPPRFVESSIGQEVLKTLIKFAQSEAKGFIKSVKLQADQMNLVIVAGGELIEKAVLLEEKGYYVLSQSIEYTVQLGDERRTFVLMTCTYPAQIAISKITLYRKDGTPASIFEEDNSGGWTWKLPADAGGGIADTLRKTSEDANYIYFDSVGTCTPQSIKEGLCDQWRASKRGLDVSSKWNNDATWEAAAEHGGGPMADKSLAE